MRSVIQGFIIGVGIFWILLLAFIGAMIVGDIFGREEHPALKVRAEGSAGTGRFGKVRGRVGAATVPDGIVIDIQPDGGGLEGELDRGQLAKVVSR